MNKFGKIHRDKDETRQLILPKEDLNKCRRCLVTGSLSGRVKEKRLENGINGKMLDWDVPSVRNAMTMDCSSKNMELLAGGKFTWDPSTRQHKAEQAEIGDRMMLEFFHWLSHHIIREVVIPNLSLEISKPSQVSSILLHGVRDFAA